MQKKYKDRYVDESVDKNIVEYFIRFVKQLRRAHRDGLISEKQLYEKTNRIFFQLSKNTQYLIVKRYIKKKF